jgi:hypothetical protein
MTTIVPSWGRKYQRGSNPLILNRTPLTAETNRHVDSERLPNAYLPELIKANGENTVAVA